MSSLQFANADDFSKTLDKKIMDMVSFLEKFPEAENLIKSLQHTKNLIHQKEIIEACRGLKALTRAGRDNAFDLRIIRNGEYLTDVGDKIYIFKSELRNLAFYPQMLNNKVTP